MPGLQARGHGGREPASQRPFAEGVRYHRLRQRIRLNSYGGHVLAKMPPKRPGPAPRVIDRAFMYECGALGLTQEEVGKLTGLSQARISQRLQEEDELREAWDMGQGEVVVSLRRAQIENAIEKGNVVAQIWLGKNLLGQRDSPKEIDMKTDVQISFVARWAGAPEVISAPPVDEVIEGEVEGDEDEEA